MNEYAHLWTFFVVFLGVALLPGLDMAYVTGASLSGGIRKGIMAVSGLMAGGAIHVIVATTGIAALLEIYPALRQALLIAGALYLALIGITLFRPQRSGNENLRPVASYRRPFLQALAVNLLNPKAYLFMLAVFPQFVRAEHGPMYLQGLYIGLIVALTQLVVYGGVAFAAGQVKAWIERGTSASSLPARVVGSLLIAMAVLSLLRG